jgi:hypothetical protein
MFFQLAEELIAVAFQQHDVVIGELGLRFLDCAFKLFSFAVYLFLIHNILHLLLALPMTACTRRRSEQVRMRCGVRVVV